LFALDVLAAAAIEPGYDGWLLRCRPTFNTLAPVS